MGCQQLQTQLIAAMNAYLEWYDKHCIMDKMHDNADWCSVVPIVW